MSNAGRGRLARHGPFGGTHVDDATDGEAMGPGRAARCDSRVDQTPLVVLERLGGEILVTDRLLGVADTRRAGET